MDRIEQLSKIELFAGLKPQGFELIAKVATEESHALGTKIFQHGDVGDKLYVIVEERSESAAMYRAWAKRRSRCSVQARSSARWRCSTRSPRSADARVHERCRLLAIPKDGFDDLLFLHKDLAYEVLWSIVRMLVGRLRETTEKLTFLSISGKF